MSEVESKIINIDGSEHEFDSLADEAKMAVAHLSQIQAEMEALQMKFVQLDAAKGVFMLTLKASLPDTEESEIQIAN
jgi:hypothetical protein